MKTLPCAIALAMATVSCGGDTSGGESCGGAAACGGDLVGTWTVVSGCSSGSGQETVPSCSQPIAFQANVSTYAGTLTFNPDSTYSSTVTVSGTSSLTYPAACLTSNGVSITCDQLSQSFAQSMGDLHGTGCSPTGDGGCACSFTIQVAPHVTPGSYTTSGNSVTVTTNGQSATNGYCVHGNQLTLDANSTNGVSGSTTVQSNATGHLVLTKQ